MTASEVAFLALGLVLGIASGAALIEVIRARPPVAREVRLTVAPNAIPSRIAATLSDSTNPAGGTEPAVGGPAELTGVAERAAALPGPGPAFPERTSTRGGRLGDRANPSPTSRPLPDLVAVPMSNEPDPLTTALRATAARTATVAMVAAARAEGRAAAERAGAGEGSAVGGTSAGDGTSAVATASRVAAASVAPAARLAAAAAARRPAGAGEARPAVSLGQASVAESSAAESSPPQSLTGPTWAATSAGASSSGRGAGTSPRRAAKAPAAETQPCAEERRVADERCAVATRAREGATTAYEAFRAVQRTHDAHVAAAEGAAVSADPRAVRSAKEEAQRQFRAARAAATTRDDVEGAARTWLAEINRINRETRDAASRAERGRAAAATLSLTLERLALEADAARISAERAEEACVAAREAVAACDEARVLQTSAAPAARPIDDVARPVPDERHAPVSDADRFAAISEPRERDDDSEVIGRGSRAGEEPLMIRILQGDHEAMQQAVARLAGSEADGGRRWQSRLSGLAEALIARSIEAVAFEFPSDHFFWSPFSRTQNRDIAAGLSSLGFRFDGFGGWVDDRVPTHRDLSLAVGYAGIDPARIRRWPNEAELAELFRDVRVAADEYVATAAAGLTLGELVTLLGRRADALTDLWNDWGSVRPVLLAGG